MKYFVILFFLSGLAICLSSCDSDPTPQEVAQEDVNFCLNNVQNTEIDSIDNIPSRDVACTGANYSAAGISDSDFDGRTAFGLKVNRIACQYNYYDCINWAVYAMSDMRYYPNVSTLPPDFGQLQQDAELMQIPEVLGSMCNSGPPLTTSDGVDHTGMICGLAGEFTGAVRSDMTIEHFHLNRSASSEQISKAEAYFTKSCDNGGDVPSQGNSCTLAKLLAAE